MNSVSKRNIALTLLMLSIAACSESERVQTSNAAQGEQLDEQVVSRVIGPAKLDTNGLRDDSLNAEGEESAADDAVQLSLEESLLSSMKAIANRQAAGSEQDDVQELENLSESDRQALQGLATQMTMEAADDKAEKQADTISEALLLE